MSVLKLLESLEIKVIYQITAQVNNIGSIFFSKNINTTNDTKHVNAHPKHTNTYREDDITKISFVKLINNIACIMKN